MVSHSSKFLGLFFAGEGMGMKEVSCLSMIFFPHPTSPVCIKWLLRRAGRWQNLMKKWAKKLEKSPRMRLLPSTGGLRLSLRCFLQPGEVLKEAPMG